MRVFKEREREIPVAGSVDVLVVGGGPTGFAAAIAAARNGAKTLLIERYDFLGGMGPGGLVNIWNIWARIIFKMKGEARPRDIEGIYKEVVDRLTKLGAAYRPVPEALTTIFDPETTKYVMDQMVMEAGVKLLLYTSASDAIVEGNKIKGVIVENKSGRQAILAKVVIDATGDGDIAARAGAPFEKGREKDGLLQPGSLMFRMGNVNYARFEEYLKQHPDGVKSLVEEAEKAGINIPMGSEWIDIPSPINKSVVTILATRARVDATSAESTTNAVIELRKQVQTVVSFLKKYVPGYEESFLIDTAPQIGIRETRRIMGEYVLTEEDERQGREFDDVIARLGIAGIDIHDPNGKGFLSFAVVPKPFDIPYRCLLPKKVDNLLVGGRCISVTHKALGATRSQHKCMALGQAAGTAAALAVKHGKSPRDIDIREVQTKLREQGAWI